MKRFLSAVLTLVLLSGIFSSCNSLSELTDSEKNTIGLRPVETIVIQNGFHGEFHKFPSDYKVPFTYEDVYSNGVFYIKGSIWEPEKENAFYTVSSTGEFSGYKSVPYEEYTVGNNQSSSISRYSVSANGIAVLQNIWNMDPKSNKITSLDSAHLNQYDFDGTLRSSADITSVFTVTDNPLTGAADTANPLSGLQDFFYGANGTVYLVNDYSVVAIDENGEKLYETEAGYYIFDSMITPDGRVMVQYSDIRTERQKHWAYMDDAVKGFSEPIEIPETDLNNPVLMMGGGHDFYFNVRDGLYFMDAGDAEPTLLCSWADSGVHFENIRTLIVPDENTVFVLSRYQLNGTNGDPEYAVLKRPPTDETNIRQVITLGISSIGVDLTNYTAQFNRQSDTYYVEIRDYTKMEGGTASSLLQEDILSGNAPDIILFPYWATENLAAKGAMADLMPYLERNPEFKADLFSAAYEPLAIGGKTYHIASGLSLQGMSGKAKNLPAADEWTPEAFLTLAQSLDPSGEVRLINASREQMKEALISDNLTTYVDFENATCSFNSPLFIRVLQYLKTIPSDSELKASDETALLSLQDERVAMRQDRILLDERTRIGSLRQFAELRLLFGGEEIAFLGMPSENGGIIRLTLAPTFSISADSPVKEGACICYWIQ